MTTMELTTENPDGCRTSQPASQQSQKILSKSFSEYSLSQQLGILKLRLWFLRKCKTHKRPPQSLRISGAPALDDTDKLFNFSVLESRNLEVAIGNLVTQIRQIVQQLKSNPAQETEKYLPQQDAQKLKHHFERKLEFFESQNDTKWNNWPQKTEHILEAIRKDRRTSRNFKRRAVNRKRKTTKDASRAIELGSVVILVEEKIPLGAIALLGKGLGYVPTPAIDKVGTRLDMKLLTNKILNQSNINLSQTNPKPGPPIHYSLPAKLRRNNYSSTQPSSDEGVNEIVSRMKLGLDEKLRKTTKTHTTNLTKDEKMGLKWLENNIGKGKIAITKADKGGATLIVKPELMVKKSLEKLENTSLYEKLDHDPTFELHDELFKLWVKGKTSNFVTPKIAKDIMGISDNTKPDQSGPTNRPSTLPHFKPGKPYFYPCLKIHKLNKCDLKPGVEPPIRLITALQEGVTRRSDVFIADRYLKALERDFCGDLLIDTNDALAWLEHVNEQFDHNTKRKLRAFTFDYKALYDSLDPELAIEALSSAINECRSEWDPEFKQWLIDLVRLSLRASIGMFNGNWYRQKVGVPTGGSICVQIANIAVYYIMRKLVYDSEELMTNIKSVKRYIDDGSGVFSGTKRQFTEFINTVNNKISTYGLNIDEHTIADPGEYVAFLDIQFCFSEDGDLMTDLYVKETDSRSYLYYGSSHPRHTFSSIVYSTSLRLRRIINNDNRLKTRLNELKECFLSANYPQKMVDNITAKVGSMERHLRPHNSSNSSILVPKSPDSKIRVISTFDSDKELLEVVKNLEPALSSTRSFSESSISSLEANLPPEPPKIKSLFKFVNKTGSSLRKKLVKVQQLTGSAHNGTRPCNQPRCATCKLIAEGPAYTINGKNVEPASGDCCSYNIIYLFMCKLCDKNYVGRTTRPLRQRVNEHRAMFYKVLNNPNIDFSLSGDPDSYCLGKHLIDEHNCSHRDDFNHSYNIIILTNSSPRTLDINEHRWIQQLKTIKPFGINSVDPFGIPLLDL